MKIAISPNKKQCGQERVGFIFKNYEYEAHSEHTCAADVFYFGYSLQVRGKWIGAKMEVNQHSYVEGHVKQ